MSLRKIIILTIITAALAVAGTASAAGRGITLSVEPQNQFVAPGESASFTYKVSNRSSSSLACDIIVVDTGFDIFLGNVNAGTTVEGQLSSPFTVNGKNGQLTFNLICGASLVDSETQLVKIR